MTASPLFVREETGEYRIATDAELTVAACETLIHKLSNADVLSSPQRVREFLALKVANLPHEIFGVMYLDAHNRLISYEEMFRGSISQTMVYPREVAKAALLQNCDGVILFHNHPGGTTSPSQADIKLTRTIQEALALIDVSVRDHIIIAAGGETLSFAEKALL